MVSIEIPFLKLVMLNFFFKFDSEILDSNLENRLIKVCQLPVKQKWELKYRGTRDGFNTKDFHSNCDGIPGSLTLIKTTSGNIFGGFTEISWNSTGGFVADPNAFIFSLINQENTPFKVMCSNEGEFAINCSAKRGPSFGGNGQYIKDIVIRSDSNANQESYSDFGYSYKHPDYLKGTDKAKSILAGSYKFQTVEIEVFSQNVISSFF